MTTTIEFDATYIYFVNIYVSVVSAVLATLWCSSTHWVAAGDEEDSLHKPVHSTIAFAPGSSTGSG